ncbi:MAG: SGNH/GDSL hydrolase family protein [Anaerolineae bacterium]|nr:SGNH/GDSL hydrolase family protein [Anaerolineae bacterium]
MNHYRLPKLSVPYLRFVGLTCLGLLALLLAGCAPSSQAARPLVYVALGASDSVGVGAAHPVQDGWVPQLQRRLPPGTRLVNLGVSGFKLSEALTQELPVALDTQPDLVTVWLAVNDFNARVNLDQYERDLDRLLTALAAQHPQRILMGNMPALERVPVYNGTGIAPNRIEGEVARWNEVIARQAQKHGVVLVDLHSQWTELEAHPDYISADGFHPSAAGYQAIADLFYQALQQSGGLAEPRP